jgi:light-harvesting protein B-800-850 alpha chain
MNEGKIWTVVKPNTGVPLFLGAVALISLTVHFAILNNTTWMAAFFQGAAKAPMTAAAPAATETAPAAATPSSAAPAPVTP